MAARHITIGPEFFAKARNDYDNWHWALVREFFQNSIDCGSGTIEVTICEANGSTIVTVLNDGDPMTEEILTDKLLCLGGSGKNFEDGATGGFGKAKEILYFCHESYVIRSGQLKVEGSGASYDLTQDQYFDGTLSQISIEGYHEAELLQAIDSFIATAQWSGEFVINDDRRKADLRKGSPRRDLGFGKVYTNKSFQYRMIVRINGVPMFIMRTGFDRCVIVELKGQSCEVMTSNRDGLVSPYKNELAEFITELSVDKRSALKNKNKGPRYKEYRGTKLCHQQAINVAEVVGTEPEEVLVDEPYAEYPESTPDQVSTEETANQDDTDVEDAFEDTDDVVEGVDVGGDAEVHEPVVSSVETGGYQQRAAAYAPVESRVEERRQVATLGTNFVLKNETDLKVPRYYDPGTGEFSSYSHKLVRYWGRIMLEMHRLFDREAEFSIGFIFDEGETGSTEAECEQGDYGLVYYLNPCRIVEQSGTYSKSFKKRFKLTERDRLISIGAHEFVHALGYGWHDEGYANRLTEVLAVVMKHRKRFNWCFQ
jgi:hypothetical protein